MQQNITLLPPVQLGEPCAYENLTLFPLLGGTPGQPDYLTLDEALAARTARVTEVTTWGSVPNLKFVNDGELPVLLLDGEELVGAKQDRVLNLSILAPAHQTLVVPVSCVESGRWAPRSEEFATSPHTQHASGRRTRSESVTQSLSASGTRTSDQRALWNDIHEKSDRMGATSATRAMGDIYRRHAADIRQYVRALGVQPGQVGAVFAINGRIQGMDLFDFAATGAKLLPKIIQSYALDAIDLRNSEASGAVADTNSAREMLCRIEESPVETFAAIGEGEDARFLGPRVSGSALLARGRTIHLSAFIREEGEAAPPRGGARITRPSRRRAM